MTTKEFQDLVKMTKINLNINGSSQISKKSILVEMLKDQERSRAILPIEAAAKYYEEILKTTPDTEQDFQKTMISFKNALDTLISNYNDSSKIESNAITRGTTLERYNDDSVIKIVG